VPEVVDLLDLGEEAVAAEVEPVAVTDGGLGDAADLVLGLEHHDGQALLGQQIAGGQPGGAAAQDDCGLLGQIDAHEPSAFFSYTTPRTPMRVARR
jgi:uncharacterized protein YbjT (DUF2867 family)